MIPTLDSLFIAIGIVVGLGLFWAAYTWWIRYMLKLFFPKHESAYWIGCFIPFGIIVTYFLALMLGQGGN